MKHFLPLFLLVFGLGSLAATAQDRSVIRISPTIAADDALGSFAPGVEFYFRREQIPCRTCKVERSGAIRVQGRLLTRPSLNNLPLSGEAIGGVAINFFKPPEYVRDARMPDARPVLRSKDYGRLDLMAHGKYQVSQDLRDHDILGGIGLGYVNFRTTGIFGWVPSVAIQGQLVLPVKTEDRELMGFSTDPFGRIRAVGSVNPAIGEVVGIDRLVGHLSADASADFGASRMWKDNGLDRSVYIEASIGYLIDQPKWYLFEVYGGIAHGRVPPELVSQTIWRFGLVMGR
jgi:hypothetical protein